MYTKRHIKYRTYTVCLNATQRRTVFFMYHEGTKNKLFNKIFTTLSQEEKSPIDILVVTNCHFIPIYYYLAIVQVVS